MSGNFRGPKQMKLVIPGRDDRGDEALVEILRVEISRAGGFLPFDRFMTQCLQHPERGYYRRGRTRAGHGGDFLTAPEAHPAFGGALARQVRELLPLAGTTWVEAGAGVGTLANGVTGALAGAATVIALDTAAHVHGSKGEHEAAPLRLRADGLPFADGALAGGIWANELLDALPVRRAKRSGGAWRELGVRLSDGGFAWEEREPAPELAAALAHAEARGGRAQDGQIVEVCPAIVPWVREAARVVSRGFVLLFDYGDDTPALWAPHRTHGTLRCFAGHAVHDDPFRFVGTQDITAHVDFGEVAQCAKESGFELVAFLDQRAWLDEWGVGEAGAALEARAERGEMRADEAEVNARAIEFLRDPRGLGKVRLLVLAKGIRPSRLAGLTSPVPPEKKFRADDLPLTRLPDPFAGLYGSDEDGD